MSRVLVAMSGGVDSSVAASLLVDAGHEVVGVTMRLWGGPADSGCCSVSDVDDARRVADRLGVDHHVFNFGDEFERDVVAPYAEAHRHGRTPNPCIECNRHLKFDRLLDRAAQLGFDAVATGHHARRVRVGDAWRIARGADSAKDQSYVLYPLAGDALAHVWFPLGGLTKSEVRAIAAAVGLATAAKPDSQDVCFIRRDAGRATFLGERIALRPARVVEDGKVVGMVDAVELVTIGQRRGLGISGGAAPRYVLDVTDTTVTVGERGGLLREVERVDRIVWSALPTGPIEATVQCSAHGGPSRATVVPLDDGARAEVRWHTPQRRVAPGQSVVFYERRPDGDAADAGFDTVVGGGIVM
ncbi:MAG TPA: tRNA 2-thiouridine(34) synthase MnmA [Microthrixaceae bacterium]|nr:tRNA 2-thiouridine(34) synthase MnmA [Microthrixaceae bacterium]HMS13196.1 tRNA 2-thiouridine(34) synthase MnmA [Microthrixaceae bacterium]HMT23939.1 tRNA 2-thiouridine(34) synthase MnmA [Microthrixaceae bacterium]HMT62260.1 tRNA 2-thiouridine(34) synthase MnmA [Microthrixaceae bacterium]